MNQDLVFWRQLAYSKKLTHPPSWYTGKQATLPIITKEFPVFIPSIDLLKITNDPTAKGYTQADLDVWFEDAGKQWQKTKTNPLTWRFAGGKVFLKMTATILVDEAAPKKPKHKEIMEVMMRHEMHHFKDDIEVLTNELTVELRKNILVKNYLIAKQEIDDGSFQRIFGSNAAGVNEFTNIACTLFAQECSKKTTLFHKSPQGSKDIVDLTNMW